MENKVNSSTPIYRVLESLGLIKKNTVASLVTAFTEAKKNIHSDGQSDSGDKSSGPEERKLFPGQVLFCNDLSTMKEESSLNFLDSGYDSTTFGHRSRSQSLDYKPINQSNVLDEYAKYPNFKFSYLKYFGEDPKTYLSKYNIDMSTPRNIARQQQKQWIGVSTSNVKRLNLSASGDLKGDPLDLIVVRQRKRKHSTPDGESSSGVDDLKLRIQESIDSYEVKCKVRRKNIGDSE